MLHLLLAVVLAMSPPPPRSETETYLRWAGEQEPPNPHPARAENWGFSADLHARIAALVREWPGQIAPDRVGRSVDKRPIWAFRVHKPGEPVRQRVLIFAQLHALEWIGAEVSVAFLEQIAPSPPPGVEVVVVPIANPDGRYWAEQDLMNDEVHSYRRANANGVDLNRDFAVNRDNDVIWSKLPFTKRYYTHSPAALSQPETRALDQLGQEGFDVVVSLHAYGGYIYVPWSGLWARTPDHAELIALGQTMAAGQERPYRVMQLCHWIFFFRALGSELDHFYGQYGSKSYLIELTHSGIQPLHPSTYRDYFRWYNPVDPTRDLQDGVGALQALVRELAYGDAGR